MIPLRRLSFGYSFAPSNPASCRRGRPCIRRPLRGAASEAQTLKTVQDRGTLICGVSQGIAGFSIKDETGSWSGFDVDFCRALAAAIFNDPSKVQYVPLSTTDRFDALKNMQIDVLSRNSTWTMGREDDFGVVFAGVTYYDGQAFLVPKSRNLTGALELDGSKVCIENSTTSEPNAMDFFETNHTTTKSSTARPSRTSCPTDLAGKWQRADDRRIPQLFALRSQFPKPSEHMICRRHLEGAARPCRSAGRRAMVQYCQVGQLRVAWRRSSGSNPRRPSTMR